MRSPKYLKTILRVASCIFVSAAGASIAAMPGNYVYDQNGHALYWLDLNESFIATIDDSKEPAARHPRDPENRTDKKGWHKPKTRKLVKDLEKEYGFQIDTMTSYIRSGLSAHLPEAVVARLKTDGRVDDVRPVPDDPTRYSAWTNRTEAPDEIIPWGKIAIGTDDSLINPSTPIYVLDGDIGYNADNNVIFNAPVNQDQLSSRAPEHATHVAGILGAKAGNGIVRGVSPGAQLINVFVGNKLDPAWKTAMDWALSDAETSRIYAVANISSNGLGFGYNAELEPYMRRLSSRLLVVQSAGNQKAGNTASWGAFAKTNEHDGIMVVGGIDEEGRQAGAPVGDPGYVNTHIPGFTTEPGSNYGDLVEVWAPSQRIYSTWPSHSTAREYLSGTSMAAPHVASLAARYGDTSTTPVQRERYIRAKTFLTGYNDLSGLAIKVPSYTQPQAFSIPSRLYPSAVTASGTLAGSSTSNVSDGLYLSGVWNAGGFGGWIEFDLGYSRSLSSIRLTPEQSPSGDVVHKIYAGNTPNPTTEVATISDKGMTIATLSSALNTTARYVRVYTQTSPSWTAWREIEVYGF